MSGITEFERKVLEGWLAKGSYQRVLRYVDLRAHAAPKLYVLRAGIRAAWMTADTARLDRFSEAVRRHYPESSVGYVEQARLLGKRNHPNEARRVLQAAPDRKRGDGELARAEQEVDAALGVLREASASEPAHRNLAMPTLDDFRELYAQAWQLGAWETAKSYAEKAIARYPDVAYGHIALAQVLQRTKKTDAALRVLERLPASAPVERTLLLAELQRGMGCDADALRTLTLSQRHHQDRRVLMRMADIHRDDNQNDRAHACFMLAECLRPDYGAVRLLTFESDMGWFDRGLTTLNKVLAFEPLILSRFLPAVNRVAVLYPDMRSALQKARSDVRAEVWRGALASDAAFEQAVRTALGCRWLSDVVDLIQVGAKFELSPSAAITARFDKIIDGLGPLRDLIELAWRNEHEAELTAICGTQVLPASDPSNHGRTSVELFIPTPFFAYDDTEKPTYETVRQVFRELAATLLTRDDVAVVPRLQLNWRFCDPRTNGRVVSYHTRAERNPAHLHIQEAPFPGFCSFDSQGFAGFASLADDFTDIEASTAKVSRAALRATHADLVQQFIVNNVSKYTQTTKNVPIRGRYVFLPMQVQTDAVAEVAWIDGLTLLHKVAAHYDGTGIGVVVKRHPYCHSISVNRALQSLSEAGKIILSSNSVHHLLADAELVITVNSGVGLEALLHERTVIVTGKCDYAYAAHSAHSLEALEALLSSPPAFDATRVMRFLHYYRHHYLVPAKSPADIQRRLKGWLEVAAQGASPARANPNVAG